MPDTRSGKIYNKELKKLCDTFNTNKTYDGFVELLDSNPSYKNRNKCKVCSNDLFYENVEFKGPFQEYPTLARGTTPYSVKIINGKEYHLCVCENCMRNYFPEWDNKNKSRIFNLPNKYSQFAFNIPNDVLNSKKIELCSRTKEGFIKKYGVIEGEERWNSYTEKQRYTNTFEYKHQKYGMPADEFDKFNKNRACTLENFIKRYGEDEGNVKWKNYVKRQAYTNSKEYFIKEYGEILGTEKWNYFNTAKKDFLGYSKISQELFYTLIEQEVFKGHDIYFAEHGGEYEIETSSGKKYYLDFYDKILNISIEFNGIKYHPKPGIYNETDIFYTPFNKRGKLVKDLWRKEEQRKNDLRNEFGIIMITIWEDDYKENKRKCICNLINDILKIRNGK